MIINKKLPKIIIIILLLIIIINVLDIPKTILKMIYPIKYENFVEQSAKEYEVDKYLILAIIKAESNFDEKAESSKGAKGLMQLMDNTAKYILKTDIKSIEENSEYDLNEDNIQENLLKAEYNIKLGTKYISFLIKKYNCIELALVAYNAGSGNVDNWINNGILKPDGSNLEEVPYKETNNYTRKILRDYEIYKNLYAF